MTIAFLKGHSVARYVLSLAPLTPLTHSAALRFATLVSLARYVHGLAHSLCSLPRGTVEILEYVFTLLSRFTGSNAFFIFTRNTPILQVSHHPPISACHAESKNFVFWQFVRFKNKFWGKSFEIHPIGQVNAKLTKFDET